MTTVGTQNEAPREAWLRETLARVPADSRLLDAGAGEQRHKKYCAHLRYIAQDFAQYDGKGDAVGLQTGAWDQSRLDIVGDIAAVSEPDASFDAILCVEVFEHIPHPVEALKEFARLLKPGGSLILTAPFCSMTHFAPFHFYTGFSRYFYSHYLPLYGFEIVEMEFNGNYFEYLAQEIRRLPDIAARYAGRRSRSLRSIALRLATWVVLKVLQSFTKADTGSAELLCYGTHLLAVKKA